MESVAIIGGGHVGMTLLADLVNTRERHGLQPVLVLHNADEETLSSRTASLVGPFEMNDIAHGERSTVHFTAEHFAAGQGQASTQVLSDASCIVITVPDIPRIRLSLFERLLREVPLAGKTLVLVRAGQSGQPAVAELLRSRDELRDCSVVLVEDSFYGTRVLGRTVQFKRKLSVNVAVYAADTERALDSVRRLFPLGERIGRPSWPDLSLRTGMELLFDPLGYIIHVGVALYPRNLELTRAGISYLHYIDGIDRELAEELDRLDEERTVLAAAYGVHADRFPAILERQYGLPALGDFYAMMQSCRGIYKSMSCASLAELKRSRLVLEDLPPLHTINWLAQSAGVDLAHTRAYIRRIDEAATSLGLEPSDGYVPVLEGIKADPFHITELLNNPLAMGD